MSTTGSSWYATNQSRRFPLAGYATGVANDESIFAEDLIADLRMWFPAQSTDVAYISYAESSEFLVLVISQDGTPIASATVRRDELDYATTTPILPLIRGVSGWVVLNPTAQVGCWTFDSPTQSGLSIRAARPQQSMDLPNRIGREGADPIRGDRVFLSGVGDVIVSQGKRLLDGVDREAVIVGLRRDLSPDVVSTYAGLCGRRPESDTCGSPIPIESINGVQADCCGRLFIEFRGCAEMLPLRNECGIVVSCDLTVDEACPDKSFKLPDDDGELPGGDLPQICVDTNRTNPNTEQQL